MDIKSKKIRIAWNTEKTRSVVLSKMKEFSIEEDYSGKNFIVKGWYNKDNFFTFGTFALKELAEAYLEDIHNLL